MTKSSTQLVFLRLVVVTSWWNACYGQNSSFSSLVPTPSMGPTVTFAPTPVPCPDELATMQSCFAGEVTATQANCEACITQYWPEQLVSCVDLVDGTCFGLAQCDCGSCADVVQPYIECLSDCTITCEIGPTSQPGPTASPAPTLPNACPEEYATFNNCVDPVNGGKGCEGCVISYWPQTLDSCTNIDDETCTGLANCNCNGCDAEMINYLTCLTNGCVIDCNSTNTTSGGGATDDGSTCPDEESAIVQCLNSTGLDPSKCADCVSGLASNADSCSAIQDAVCTGLETCECGDCASEILAGVNCAFPICNLVSCDGNNGTSSGGQTPSASPPVDTPTASGGSDKSPLPAPTSTDKNQGAPTSGISPRRSSQWIAAVLGLFLVRRLQ